MFIHVTKELQPVLVPLAYSIKTMEQYDIKGYNYKNNILEAPNNEVDLDKIKNMSRAGILVDRYPVWFEIPNANLYDDVPSGLTFSTYEGSGGTVNRQWSGVTLYITGTSSSIRYWQYSNNIEFNFDDVEIIEEAGFTVLGQRDLEIRRNEDEYTNSGDSALEIISFIDANWGESYFDIIHATLRMKEIYLAKGNTNNQRWNSCTDQEKEILVRWNLVGINRASQLVNPDWSESRQLKEISKKYREFNINMVVAAEKRYNDWYQYLNMTLSPQGNAKFVVDWDWGLKHEYMNRYLRQFELGDVNKLVDFNTTILGSYVDADFIGTDVTATQIVNTLEKVLTNKRYFI